jgi:hypothetical protein
MINWLAALAKSERLAYPFIYSGVRGGSTASDVMQAFRSGGGHIQTQKFYNLWRYVDDLVYRGSLVKYLPRSATPRRASLPMIGLRQMREYSFTVNVKGRAPRSEGDDGYFVTVSSSSLMSRGEIESLAKQTMTSQYQDATAGDYEYVLVHGQRAMSEE